MQGLSVLRGILCFVITVLIYSKKLLQCKYSTVATTHRVRLSYRNILLTPTVSFIALWMNQTISNYSSCGLPTSRAPSLSKHLPMHLYHQVTNRTDRIYHPKLTPVRAASPVSFGETLDWFSNLIL